MTDKNDPDWLDSSHYSDILDIPSPSGTLRRCLHLESMERRGLKILRPDLVQNHAFFVWYTAAVTLAGQASKTLRLPTLISPIATPSGRWISLRDREHVVERRFFGGTEQEPAFNLSKFVHEYRSRSRGIDESAALAVLRLIVSTLERMHDAKMTGEQGVRLTGIPHLNLKPENVIVGKDIPTQEYQIRLTDYLIPMASPLVESAGIHVPLNYSSAKILQDSGYYGLSADIFSCGLLLYRLVEDKDLIRADLSRQSTLDFIRTQLPQTLKQLRLSKAGARTREIIVRCLTGVESETFASVRELGQEIDRALRSKDPGIILTGFVEQFKPEPPPKPPIEIPWKKIALGAASLLVVVAGIFGYLALVKGWKKADVKEISTEVDGQLEGVKDCVGRNAFQLYSNKVNEAKDLVSKDQYEQALTSYKQLQNSLSIAVDFCRRMEQTTDSAIAAKNNKQSFVTFDEIWPLIESAIISAQSEGRAARFDNGLAYLDSADQAISLLKTRSEWECDEQANMERLQAVLQKVGNLCKDKGEELFDQAQRACRDVDSAAFNQARRKLRGLARNAECVSPPDCNSRMPGLAKLRNSLKGGECYQRAVDLYSDAQVACRSGNEASFDDLYRQMNNLVKSSRCKVPGCAEERQLVESARSVLTQKKRDFAKAGLPPFDSCHWYIEGIKHLIRAEELMATDSCDKIKWRATSAESSFVKLIPCVAESKRLDDIAGCLDKNPRLTTAFRDSALAIQEQVWKCNCEPATQKRISYLESSVLDSLEAWNPGSTPSLGDCSEADTARYTSFEECKREYNRGAYNRACEVCEKVAPTDPRYRTAQKYFVIVAGYEQKFGSDFRGRLQKAIGESNVDNMQTAENAKAFITMTCVYGWDINRIDVPKALEYFNKARSLGLAVRDSDIWWQAKLVKVRCEYLRWRDEPTNISLRQDTRSEARSFLDFMQKNPIPHSELYLKEVKAYLDTISFQE